VKLHKISIPYGAIKSLRAFILNKWLDKISIPYGAIKRSGEKWLGRAYLNFNSLWCD